MDHDDTGSVMPANNEALFGDVAVLIDGARERVAATVNSELVMLYWSVGKRVREAVLGGERAAYGQQVIKLLSERLTERYGRGWSQRGIERMVVFAGAYPSSEIATPLASQLTWTNISELLTIPERRKRDFYLAFCAHERWSKRTLRARVAGKLYERTVAARGCADGLEVDLAALTTTGSVESSLAFRDPYVLDFVVGQSITPEYLAENPHLKFATGPDETGVIISWNTEAESIAATNPVTTPGDIAINPITWTTSEETASASQNLGSIVLNPFEGGKPVMEKNGQERAFKNMADARVDKRRGVVVCSTPNPKHYEFGFPEGVYHTFDYPFYFFNIRANAAQRIQTYLAGSGGSDCLPRGLRYSKSNSECRQV